MVASWRMHQAVEIKLQGKALSVKKNKPVVCCRSVCVRACVHVLHVWQPVYVCVSESVEREREGGSKRRLKKKREKREGRWTGESTEGQRRGGEGRGVGAGGKGGEERS